MSSFFHSWNRILIILLTMLSAHSLSSQDNQLIYIGDPMCSWCYGFGPELDKIKSALPDLDFKMVMGGLRPYGKETMADLSNFLRTHWSEIEERTGQKFKYDILSQNDFIYDTEPASRAVVTFRQFRPNQELDFFHDVQKLFYAQNKNPHDVQSYSELISKYGIDQNEFIKYFESKEMEAATLKDFQFSGQLGIRGFPSLVLKKGKQHIMISNGYQKAEAVISNIEKMLNQKVD